MDYTEIAGKLIDLRKLPETPMERISARTRGILDNPHVIDVHAHMFDTKCINKAYFILRFLKDQLGIRAVMPSGATFPGEEQYGNISINEEGWEEELSDHLSGRKDDAGEAKLVHRELFDALRAVKFLTFSKMGDVHKYYVGNYSAAEVLGLKRQTIISTALMMDLETGWNVSIKKSLYEQVTELKRLSRTRPLLPFLYCDPRRADIQNDSENNLYSLFNYSFCHGTPLFGVKIYPALGYDPSDYRLWPIYAICEKYAIPVLTHCGGETVSTDKLIIEIFEGTGKKTIKAEDRKTMAYTLNDPHRWGLVLEKFPALKLDFGHFGGYETWDSSGPVVSGLDPQQRKECIFNFMEKYSNVYADFAFNLVEDRIADNLVSVIASNAKVRQRTLFGTDYWMVTPNGNLKKEIAAFVKKLEMASAGGIDLKSILMIENPWSYLFG